MSRRLAAIVAALALCLGTAGTALAATSTVSESVTVLSSVTLSLDTATLNYGPIAPGATTDPVSVHATIGSTGGWALSITGSAFTSGANTMPASARQFTGGGQAPSPATGALPISDHGTAGGSFGYYFAVTPPAAQQPGVYTGTLTFTLSGT